MKTAIKIILWTIMGALLAGAASLICAVKLLTPDRLTPIVRHLADRYLDADVDLASVRLSFDPAFPILRVSLDSAAVISHAFNRIPQADRRLLPQYADTVLAFDHFSGAIALNKLIASGEIALSDVILRGPSVNIVIASDSVYNFDLLPPSPEDSTEVSEIPAFSIDRFRLEDAKAIRYFNAVDSTDATVVLLSDAGLDGSQAPAYRIKIDGNIFSPAARSFLDLDSFAFGADGSIRWDPADPHSVSLSDFNLSGRFIRATLNSDFDFADDMVIRSASLALDPIPLDSLLPFIPQDMRRRYRLEAPYLRTDAAISLAAALRRPFNLTYDSIPVADLSVSIPDEPLTYGRSKFSHFALDLLCALEGNNPDAAVVNLRKFRIAGPATNIDISGEATRLIDDPDFSGCIRITSDLAKLPPIVANLAGGYISGTIDADIDINARASMFAQDKLHRINAHGHLDAKNLFFLRNDTNLMADIRNTSLKFGTDVKLKGRRGKVASKPSLAASIRVDTANILSGGVDVALGQVFLGIGVENSGIIGSADTTLVLPMGGKITVGRFNVISVADSAGMHLRDLSGSLRINRFKGNNHSPRLSLNCSAKRISAGAPIAKVILLDPAIKVRAHKLEGQPKRVPRRIRSLADSIARVHPDLAPDSVMKLAIEKHRHRPGQKVHHRVHTALSAEDQEILEWGTSSAFRKLLLDWDIRGSISTRKARLFSPAFPIRNRINNVDITFNTDSIVISNLLWKTGRSDLNLNGVVSNIKRGFTSAGFRSPLKANLLITSRKIDINEIAAATFAGAAYTQRLHEAEKHRQSQRHIGITGFDIPDGDEELDRRIQELADSAGTGPLLIPTNLDAQLHLMADSVFYSDLSLAGLTGDVLLYRGALNLHNLSCASQIGALTLDALYQAPSVKNMKFGFGLDARRFDIARFLKLVPAVDSIMPLMRDFGGIISADIAATCDIDSAMNILLPSLDAAIRLQGDSLTFVDPKTYRTIGKWLGFKDKDSNIIDHLNVEMTVADNVLQVYPFIIDIDRYKLGVQGYNDLDLNFDYHLAVLKSPIPFRFGITVKGNPDKYKVRFGGAKFKQDSPAAAVAIVDTARINLISQIQNIFRRGISGSRFARINSPTAPHSGSGSIEVEAPLSRADSLALAREGILSPEESRMLQRQDSVATADKPLRKNDKRKRKNTK